MHALLQPCCEYLAEAVCFLLAAVFFSRDVMLLAIARAAKLSVPCNVSRDRLRCGMPSDSANLLAILSL